MLNHPAEGRRVVTEIHISDLLLNISYIVLSKNLQEMTIYSERYCSRIMYFQPVTGIKLGLKDCFVSCYTERDFIFLSLEI